MNDINNFYVYCHIRLDTDTPFYVGKGKNNRAHSKHNRSKYWNNIVKKYGYIIEIIEENLSEDKAFKKETEFVKLYKSQGFCEANFTDGGDGASGAVRSEETRQKMSEAAKGRKPWITGKKHTEETLKKMSEAQKGKKHSEETKKRLSISHWSKNKTISKQSREKISKTLGSNEFKVYTKTNQYVGNWKTLSSCARDLNLQASGICCCLKGKSKFHKGYKFYYV